MAGRVYCRKTGPFDDMTLHFLRHPLTHAARKRQCAETTGETITQRQVAPRGTMGKFDRRNSQKMKRRKAQTKKKERVARKAAPKKAVTPAKKTAAKKTAAKAT